MNTNDEKNRELAKWIKSGWKRREANRFRHRYLAVENSKYTILLYTLKFALMGKEGSLEKGKAALEEKVCHAKDPFAATAKFFGVSKNVVKEIDYLEGPYENRRPIEIAEILERGEIHVPDRFPRRVSGGTIRKR